MRRDRTIESWRERDDAETQTGTTQSDTLPFDGLAERETPELPEIRQSVRMRGRKPAALRLR